MTETLSFRAHARLLTMLGEQLIKNERIALVELVKNAYDADATQVLVDFRDFGRGLSVRPESAIVVTDNGSGMSEQVIRTAWMNPATPSKAITKRTSPRTKLGRILQGEKGIGRFAAFKLGNNVSLISRAEGSLAETTVRVDVSGLDEYAEGSAPRLDYYLEDVAAVLDSSAEPNVFDGGPGIRSSHGTQLHICGLRAPWSESLAQSAFDDLDRLQPLMWGPSDGVSLRADFTVTFLQDGADMGLGARRAEDFSAVLDRAVLRITNGRFDIEARAFTFDLNDRPVRLNIDDSEVRGLRLFRARFLQGDDDDRPQPRCGSFGFEFFVFDFSTSAPAQYELDREEKDLLKHHRVYLYRDGIRVYPYGDPDDDWLQVDVIRGTQSARSMFSNDQTVGYVTITQAENAELRDKTNREGLLEAGPATGDFVALIQTVLSYLRSKPYEQYSLANRRVRERTLERHRVDQHVEALRKVQQLPAPALKHLDQLQSAVQAERDLASLQVARTEQLAGVGLSVETASHDLIAAATEALRLARHVVAELKLQDVQGEPVYAVAASLVTRLEFIVARFQDVQGLFVSTRQKQANHDVFALVRRVKAMYAALHKDKNIEFQIDASSRLHAVTTEGAVLQCVINLVDNATYWLMTSPHQPRVIRAFASDERTLVISDNGPGVKPQDEPFIFEAFYSGKGDQGKGLGLYIARQNGLRNAFDVELVNGRDDRTLPGATFEVRFRDTGEKS